MTRSALCSAALFLALRVLVAADPITLGEPLPWRWVRAVCEHPWRSPAALFCLLTALQSTRRTLQPDRAGQEPGAPI